ncbi:hypothetical protein FACS1894200_08130 [Spirochaetia bacterium]|nr:hypothetical protein FACS1894200_08130 [Spirochaetia bacterium]
MLKDVCDVLRIGNVTDTANRLDEDEKSIFDLIEHGRTYQKPIVNESGLYNIIIRSDKPEAKAFKRWITHEILPSIRKNGGYIANQEQLTPEQIIANALVVAHRILADREAKLKEVENQNDELRTLTDNHANRITVLRYCVQHGLKLSNKQRIDLGKSLSSISRENELPIYQVRADDPSGRYSYVNSYTADAWKIYEATECPVLLA